MKMNEVVFEIDKPVEINRKENLRDHHLYWIGRRTQDVILSFGALVVLSPVMLATAIAIVVDDDYAGKVSTLSYTKGAWTCTYTEGVTTGSNGAYDVQPKA